MRIARVDFDDEASHMCDMRHITISAETLRLLERHRRGSGWAMEPRLRPDGRYGIDVDDDVYERLEAIAPGDPDAAIAVAAGLLALAD